MIAPSSDRETPVAAGPAPTASVPQRPPLFTILACGAALLCLGTPRLLLMLPVMVAAGCGVTAWFRQERWRIGGVIAAGLALCLMLLSAWDLAATTSANLGAAQLVSWNWVPDPTFGGHGTIKWIAEVKNVSGQPIASARVDFATYDASGKLLASNFTFVSAIPPGETRTSDAFADYYGTEADAKAVVSEVTCVGGC